MLGREAQDFFSNGAPQGTQRERAVKAARNALSAGVPEGEVIDLVWQGFGACEQDPRRPWTYKDALTLVDSLVRSPAPPPKPLTPQLELDQPAAPEAPVFQRLGDWLLTRDKEERAPLIEGILDAGRSHWLWAMAGSGKTLWTLDLSFSLITGRAYHGRAVQQGDVVMIERDSTNQLDDYIEVVVKAGGYDWERVKQGFILSDHPSLHTRDKGGVQTILAHVDSFPNVKLVVIDSFKDMVSLSAGWASMVDGMKLLKDGLEKRGIALLVIDHAVSQAGREDEGGLKRDPLETLYGGAIKQATFDTGLYWRGKLREGPAVVTWAKLRTSQRDDLQIAFDEDNGFTVAVHLPPEKLALDLSRKEQRLIEMLTEQGPLSTERVMAELDISRATLHRMTVNKLLPRGLVVREGGGGRGNHAVLKLGPNVGVAKPDTTLDLDDF